ncbi:MAG TPA: VWA domain-containing protein [Terriglobia bacterium]|nr:VWA domain-containing protein [Terriglobia bacterium]
MSRIVAGVLSLVVSLAALAQTPEGGSPVSVSMVIEDSRGKRITSVRPEDFQAFEDGVERPVLSIIPETGPMDVGALVDTRTGVIPTLQSEAEAAAAFLRSVIRTGDLGFLVSYNTQVDVLQTPAEDPRLIERSATRIPGYGRYVVAPQPRSIPLEPVPAPLPLPIPKPLPNTPPAARPLPPVPMPNRPRGAEALRGARLYDAVMLATDRFLVTENARNVMVILALSDDVNSAGTLEEALRALKRNHVTAYVLQMEQKRPGIGAIISGLFRRSTAIRRDDYDIPHFFSGDDERRIARLAEETGGRMIKVGGPEKLSAAYAEIAEDISGRQILTFRASPSDGNETRPRRLEIRTRIKGARVFAANAFYPETARLP